MKEIRLPPVERWPRPLRRPARALQLPWRRLGYALGQLLERRIWLFVVADAVFVFGGLVQAAITGAEVEHVYSQSVYMPSLLLAVPALSGVVALERRSGSLDLALSVPSTELFFLRRVLPVLALLGLQGFVLLTVAHVDNSGGWLTAITHLSELAVYVRALAQMLLLLAFLGAGALFWATRLQSSGGVGVAQVATLVAFWPWLSISPRPGRLIGTPERLLGLSLDTLAWWGSCLVVALATLILYLYARERLRRPETMLT